MRSVEIDPAFYLRMAVINMVDLDNQPVPIQTIYDLCSPGENALRFLAAMKFVFPAIKPVLGRKLADDFQLAEPGSQKVLHFEGLINYFVYTSTELRQALDLLPKTGYEPKDEDLPLLNAMRNLPENQVMVQVFTPIFR